MFHRIVQVFTNGTTDKLDGLTYDGAHAMFYPSLDNPNILYVAWLELGFGGTSDAQWVVINESAKYAGLQ